MIKKLGLIVLAFASLGCLVSFGEGAKTNSLPADPDLAWKEIETASKAPPIPKDWAPQGPTAEQRQAFEKVLAERSTEVAEKSREFYTRFPDHPKASDAKAREQAFTQQAIRFGNKSLAEKSDANLAEDEKVKLKLNEAHRHAMAKRPEGLPAIIKDFEAGLREVMKEFPNNPMPWQAMFAIIDVADVETQKRLLDELVASKAPDDETRARAKGLLKAIGALGRPLELSYTAIDGRSVDVQKLKGKVVLVDFWATWCGPCMMELPNVIETYQKYHDKGFEIVGISLDVSKADLQHVVEKYKMPWPQYFDGQRWGNKFVIEYNISAVPTMWLVDKAGKLRNLKAQTDLEKNVEDLLKEDI